MGEFTKLMLSPSLKEGDNRRDEMFFRSKNSVGFSTKNPLVLRQLNKKLKFFYYFLAAVLDAILAPYLLRL